MGGLDPLSAIAGVGGDVIGGLIGLQGVQMQNQANAQQAQNQMNFQEQMSDTAHQREVVDLQKAGLNPMLSVNAGASSPSGAMATMQNTMAPVQQGITNATDAIAKSRGIQQQQDMNDSNVAVNAANKVLLDKRAATESANASAAQETAKQASMQSARMQAGQDAAVKIAPYQPYIDTAGKVIGIGVNALEGGSALGAAMKYMNKAPVPINNLPDGLKNMSPQDLQQMGKQYQQWKLGK